MTKRRWVGVAAAMLLSCAVLPGAAAQSGSPAPPVATPTPNSSPMSTPAGTIEEASKRSYQPAQTIVLSTGDKAQANDLSTSRPTCWIQVLAIVWSWPTVVVVIALVLALWPQAARRAGQLLPKVKSVSVLGTQLELSPESARELAASADETFDAYRRRANREFDRQKDIHDLDAKVRQLLQHDLQPFFAKELGDQPKGLRCTIHVPDILFRDSLYQLLDYYPKGGGRGRVFSIRYGIIGKVWRLQVSDSDSDVSTDPNDLVRDWGMTYEEAVKVTQQRRSFCCALLRDNADNSVGVLFMDAEDRGQFSTSKNTSFEIRLHELIVDNCRKRQISESLSLLCAEMRKNGPLIQVHA